MFTKLGHLRRTIALSRDDGENTLKGFHKPENYDKIVDLPDNKELWAGANDWENGWSWGWIARCLGGRHGKPEIFVRVDHSKCPGCKGENGEPYSDKKKLAECREYAKKIVFDWASEKTGKKIKEPTKLARHFPPNSDVVSPKDTHAAIISQFGQHPQLLSAWMAINHHLNPEGATPHNAGRTSHILSKWLEVHPLQRKDSFNARRVLGNAGIAPEVIPALSETLTRHTYGGIDPEGFIPRSPLDVHISRVMRGGIPEPTTPERDAAKFASRPGIVRAPTERDFKRREAFAARQRKKTGTGGSLTANFREKLKGATDKMLDHYGAMKLAAKYDAPLPFASVLQRATDANYKTFLEHITKVLHQSGVIPQTVSPAIHDVNGAARVSLFAAGQYRNPAAPGTAAAWSGLLGRQPGMLSFQSSPQGQDSIYKFQHGDADAIQRALNSVGVTSRTLVPDGKSFSVYVYDKGRQKREAVASAVGQLGVPVDEWRGTGTPVGGKEKDMGRSQYRDVINASEGGLPSSGGAASATAGGKVPNPQEVRQQLQQPSVT